MSEQHEIYEILLVKAVDNLLSNEESQQLEAHLAICPECASEFKDFNYIKNATDAMTARILQDAAIEAPRVSKRASILIRSSFILILFGVLMVLGVALYHFMLDPTVPLVIKTGLSAITLGLAGLFGYVLHIRVKAIEKDPYEEIDQ